MYDTAEPEAEDRPVAARPTEGSPLAVPPFLRLAGDGDDDENEQHICRGID